MLVAAVAAPPVRSGAPTPGSSGGRCRREHLAEATDDNALTLRHFESTEAIGSSKWRAFIRHVVPNIMPVIIIGFSINIGGVILSIASLGFLGYGLPFTIPEWGGLLSREGREFMEIAPRLARLALLPGLALTITVYCLNMFGDAVRDLLDPRLRGGAGGLGAGAAGSVQ